MNERLDVLRSLLREAAVTVRDGVRDSGFNQALRKLLEEVARRTAVVSHERLTAAVGRAPGVSAASVRVVPGAIQLEVAFTHGDPCLVSLLPLGAAFAPHGAKEISFQVEPPNLADDTRVGDLVAAIGGEVAHALWAQFVRGMPIPSGHALATRDRASYSVDLRGVPLVRAAMGNRLTATAIELLHVVDIEAEQDHLKLTLALRGMP